MNGAGAARAFVVLAAVAQHALSSGASAGAMRAPALVVGIGAER